MFAEVGAVAVSDLVEHRLMTTRPGKAMVANSVHRHVAEDSGSAPCPVSLPGTPWRYGVYPLPGALGLSGWASDLWVAVNGEDHRLVLLPCEQYLLL
jgi:hypothetical protein